MTTKFAYAHCSARPSVQSDKDAVILEPKFAMGPLRFAFHGWKRTLYHAGTHHPHPSTNPWTRTRNSVLLR